jgi:hypothetical protein
VASAASANGSGSCRGSWKRTHGAGTALPVIWITAINHRRVSGSTQAKYELHPIKAAQREIEARVWSLIHDHPTLKASLSRAGGAYEIAKFTKLEGRPNWTMEWTTDDRLAKAAFEQVVLSVQTQIELE